MDLWVIVSKDKGDKGVKMISLFWVRMIIMRVLLFEIGVLGG